MATPGEKAALEKGGIAWGGSLVGINNPSNLGFRYSTPHKRYKYASSSTDDDQNKELPSSLIIQFQNRNGDELGSNMDVPTSSNVDELSSLINSLLSSSNSEHEQTPYSFYAKLPRTDDPTIIDDVEITSNLSTFFTTHPQISTETVFRLTYHPLALFRVRPVTRCTDTMPGHTDAILHLSFSPDGKRLASGGGDTTVRFWDVNTCLPKETHRIHKNHVLCTAWSPDGTRFASADKNGTLVVWNAAETGSGAGAKSAAVIAKAHRKWITRVEWEPHHRNKLCERLVTSSKDFLCKIWNARTRRCLFTLAGHVDSVEDVKWGGEGLIYTASRDRLIKVWNDAEGKLCKTLKGHAHRINALALSCEFVCRTGGFEPDAHKRKTTTNNVTTTEEAYEAAATRYRAFKAAGEPERLISGSDDFTLFLWHPTESKHPIKRLTGHQQLVNHIAFSPDGRYFASASFDKKIKVWNGKSGEFITTLHGHVGSVYRVAWSPDSRYLVSGSKDATGKLWEMGGGVAKKAAKETLAGHEDEIYALDWSPYGGSVASGSKDRTIKIWKH